MSFFKKLFGGGKPPVHTEFAAGDIIYTEKKGVYSVFKILLVDQEHDGLHVKGYEGLEVLPTVEELPELRVKIHHFPLVVQGFDQPRLLTRSTVEDHDLLGYFEYIKQTQQTDEVVKYAKRFYQEAYQLSEEQRHEEAIAKYSQAIDLIPAFVEAIDNRAFSKMDLEQWREAIVDFQESLKIEPNSLLALFTMSKCYVQLGEYPQAKRYLEQAVTLSPEQEESRALLQQVEALLEK